MRLVRKVLSREEECQRILDVYGAENFELISGALDRQFLTLHNRAQLLLGICGVLISASVLVTTGRLIGRRPEFAHRHMAGYMLVIAGIVEISAAAVVVAGVLNIRWITKQPGEGVRAWVLSNIAYRDKKTAAYRLATLLLLVSMILFQVAITIALLEL